MKTVKQQAEIEITIRRFDTGENFTFVQDVPVEVDDATANYLLTLKCFDENGVSAANFMEVV